MNKIEELKRQKDGLDVGDDIPRYARLGVDAIEEGDVDRLKWWGVFLRKQTPGHFMMRLRIPNGVATSAQLRTIAAIASGLAAGSPTSRRGSRCSSDGSGSATCRTFWTSCWPSGS